MVPQLFPTQGVFLRLPAFGGGCSIQFLGRFVVFLFGGGLLELLNVVTNFGTSDTRTTENPVFQQVPFWSKWPAVSPLPWKCTGPDCGDGDIIGVGKYPRQGRV